MLKYETKPWNQEEDKALTQLIEIYGKSKPTDICHQMKNIYGFYRKPSQIMDRIKKINPENDFTRLTNEQLVEAWDLQKQFGLNWNLMAEKMNKNKLVIRTNLTSKYRVFLRKMNRIFGLDKNNNKEKISALGYEPMSLSLQLYQDKNPPEDQQYLQVQQKAREFIKLFDDLIRIKYENDEDLFEKMNKFTSKQQIQQIFEYLFLLNTMQNIAQKRKNCDKIQSLRRQSIYQYFQKDDKNKFFKHRLVKTWEQAENLGLEIKDSSNVDQEIIDLNEREIQLIKQSPLFQKLFPNHEKRFWDYYNEAKQSFQDNKQFTYIINENSRLHQVPRKINLKQDTKLKIKLPIWKKFKIDREKNLKNESKRFLRDYLNSFFE